MDAAASPGRTCPLHYHYGPEVFGQAPPAQLRALDVLYVVGGLYGNETALHEVLRLFEAEPGRKQLVFNGDFHWFDTDPVRFARIQHAVLAHTALRGNVETELADPEPQADAGCGCAYPDWVGHAVVERSNRILQRLRSATTPRQRLALAALPMWLTAEVGDCRIGIVHGDAQSLAGWGFAQEHLRDAAGLQQVRDWLYVGDHCSALRRMLEAGRLGETYNIGGWNEKANIDVVHTLCALLDELAPRERSYSELITFVTDRPGHDRRYAIDARKAERELGWRPAETFETGMRKTVQWYLDHQDWVRQIQSGDYMQWIDRNYSQRTGAAT
jgi:hypothetical protein